MTEELNPEEARRTLAAARVRSMVTDTLVQEARSQLGQVRAHREANHYRDKFRAILKGRAA